MDTHTHSCVCAFLCYAIVAADDDEDEMVKRSSMPDKHVLGSMFVRRYVHTRVCVSTFLCSIAVDDYMEGDFFEPDKHVLVSMCILTCTCTCTCLRTCTRISFSMHVRTSCIHIGQGALIRCSS